MLATNVQLAWHFYRQEKHLAHHRFMAWTQAILMIFIVTLSQTSQSIQSYLTGNLNSLLGADIVVSQSSPLLHAQRTKLNELSDKVVTTKSLSTTITHNDKWQKIKLKAVGNGYPLQGALKTSVSLNAQAQSSLSGPALGEIWVDSRLLASLSLSVGDTLNMANQSFKLTRILQHEPDRLMEGHNVQMRAMINLSDLDSLSLPQDLIKHRYLIAANAKQTSNIIAWQKTHLPAAQISHKQGAHPLALFWQRTENFIGLASIILFFMAAIAIEQLTHVKMQKEKYFSAVCMSLGASKMTGFQISVLKWFCHWVFMLPAVLIISAVLHAGLVRWLGHTFPDLVWYWDMLLATKAIFAISAVLLIFQLPIWVGLKQSSIAQLVNNIEPKKSAWLTSGCAILVLFFIAMAYSDNGLLTAMVLVSVAVCVILILAVSWFALTAGEKLTQNISGLMPFALFMMRQRLVGKSTQILGVGLCAFLLLFTLMLMRDLGNTMSAYQRQHDGNLLVSQATESQMTDLRGWASNNRIDVRQSKPYMHAKLTEINGQHLSDIDQSPSESLATFKQSIRLHWSETIPTNNRLIDGFWWKNSENHWQQISIEEEVMMDLGLNIGDKLTFFISQQNHQFTIVASHAYKPGAGSITFWVQMPPSALDHVKAPHYTMASLELAPQQFSMLGALWKKHPTLRMVSLDEMTARFDTILAMVTQVISGFSLVIIVLAFIVILSSSHALESKEKKKNSIILSFGFNKETCLKLNLIEWIFTGFIAAMGAIAGTYIAGVLIYQSQFSLQYQPDFLWLIGTMGIILTIVTLLGVYASRKSLSSSIRQLLSE